MVQAEAMGILSGRPHPEAGRIRWCDLCRHPAQGDRVHVMSVGHLIPYLADLVELRVRPCAAYLGTAPARISALKVPSGAVVGRYWAMLMDGTDGMLHIPNARLASDCAPDSSKSCETEWVEAVADPGQVGHGCLLQQGSGVRVRQVLCSAWWLCGLGPRH